MAENAKVSVQLGWLINDLTKYRDDNRENPEVNGRLISVAITQIELGKIVLQSLGL